MAWDELDEFLRDHRNEFADVIRATKRALEPERAQSRRDVFGDRNEDEIFRAIFVADYSTTSLWSAQVFEGTFGEVCRMTFVTPHDEWGLATEAARLLADEMGWSVDSGHFPRSLNLCHEHYFNA